MSNEKRYLTLEEAAEKTGISIKALRKRITEGVLPGYKPGRNVLVAAVELDMFIKKSRMKAS